MDCMAAVFLEPGCFTETVRMVKVLQCDKLCASDHLSGPHHPLQCLSFLLEHLSQGLVY